MAGDKSPNKQSKDKTPSPKKLKKTGTNEDGDGD